MRERRCQGPAHGVSSVAFCLALLAACSPADRRPGAANDVAVPPTAAASAPQSSKPHYSLGIVGYNYTEVGIDDYTVNGTGGFNLGVSNEHSGGGSTICCAGWAPGTRLPQPMVVEWKRSDNDGNPRWCRATAMLSGPVPLEPTTLEIHFYPDRRVEAAITDRYSPPRLKLAARGADYRTGKDVRAENAEAISKDTLLAECRDSEFPIDGKYYSEQLEKYKSLQGQSGR